MLHKIPRSRYLTTFLGPLFIWFKVWLFVATSRSNRETDMAQMLPTRPKFNEHNLGQLISPVNSFLRTISPRLSFHFIYNSKYLHTNSSTFMKDNDLPMSKYFNVSKPQARPKPGGTRSNPLGALRVL